MRTLMVGAGAIGGYFGGRAAEAGADVTFLVRPRRAAQLASDGLVIRSPRGDLGRSVATVQAGALGGPYDAVVLSCKAYDLDDAIASFAPAAGPDTAILPLLNGMRHLDVLEARFGPGAVLGGQCQIAATLEPDGTIRHLGDLQALSLGERDGSMSPRVEALAAAFAGCGGQASKTILQDMWAKWVFLASLACLTSSMRAAVGDVAAAGGTWLRKSCSTRPRPSPPPPGIRRGRRSSGGCAGPSRRRGPRSPPPCCGTSSAGDGSRRSTSSAT